MKVRINTVDGDRYVARLDRPNLRQLVEAFHAGDPVLSVVVAAGTRKKPREVMTHLNRDSVVSIEELD